MVKTIIKEVCIMLLLCIAIILVLGVVFYDSIPSNKVVPNKLSEYKTPENIQTEIDEQVTEMNKIEVSYEITSSDLSLYKQTHSYTSGKPDPFSTAATAENTATNGGTANQGTNTNTSTNSVSSGNTTTNTDPNSTGTFYNNTGLK